MEVDEIARAFLASESAIAEAAGARTRQDPHRGHPLRIPARGPAGAHGCRSSRCCTSCSPRGTPAAPNSYGKPSADRGHPARPAWSARCWPGPGPGARGAGDARAHALQHPRTAARLGEEGDLILLQDQDRSQWDADMIGAAPRRARRCRVRTDEGRRNGRTVPSCRRRSRAITPPPRPSSPRTSSASRISTSSSLALRPRRSSVRRGRSRSATRMVLPPVSRRSMRSPTGGWTTITTRSTPPGPNCCCAPAGPRFAAPLRPRSRPRSLRPGAQVPRPPDAGRA